MPPQVPRVYSNGVLINAPVIATGQVTTNASGVARFYITDNGTATGNPLFPNNDFRWSADVTAGVQVNSRTSTLGSNYIDVTVTNLQFNGIVLLGITVLGSVTVTPVTGVTVQFIVVGT